METVEGGGRPKITWYVLLKGTTSKVMGSSR
jgi:hypothetical protein